MAVTIRRASALNLGSHLNYPSNSKLLFGLQLRRRSMSFSSGDLDLPKISISANSPPPRLVPRAQEVVGGFRSRYPLQIGKKYRLSLSDDVNQITELEGWVLPVVLWPLTIMDPVRISPAAPEEDRRLGESSFRIFLESMKMCRHIRIDDDSVEGEIALADAMQTNLESREKDAEDLYCMESFQVGKDYLVMLLVDECHNEELKGKDVPELPEREAHRIMLVDACHRKLGPNWAVPDLVSGYRSVYVVLLLDDPSHTEELVLSALPNVINSLTISDAKRIFNQSRNQGAAVIIITAKRYAELYVKILKTFRLRTATKILRITLS